MQYLPDTLAMLQDLREDHLVVYCDIEYVRSACNANFLSLVCPSNFGSPEAVLEQPIVLPWMLSIMRKPAAQFLGIAQSSEGSFTTVVTSWIFKLYSWST